MVMSVATSSSCIVVKRGCLRSLLITKLEGADQRYERTIMPEHVLSEMMSGKTRNVGEDLGTCSASAY